MNDLLTAQYRISLDEIIMFAETDDNIIEMVKHNLCHSLAVLLYDKLDIESETSWPNYDKTYKMSFAALTKQRYIELLKAERDLLELRKIMKG